MLNRTPRNETMKITKYKPPKKTATKNVDRPSNNDMKNNKNNNKKNKKQTNKQKIMLI
jgi:hypothetical protein